MIRFLVCDSLGEILRSGFAASLRGAYIQAAGGERVFVMDDIGFLDTATLKVDFNNMLIVVKEGVSVSVQGENTPVQEITSEPQDA